MRQAFTRMAKSESTLVKPDSCVITERNIMKSVNKCVKQFFILKIFIDHGGKNARV
jgi:hypothetical protein